MTNFQRLAAMGWRPFFQQQLTLEEWDQIIPARVTEQHKSQLTVAADPHTFTLPITPAMPPLVVGDWILLNENKQFVRLLERYSCFKRKSAGTGYEWQLIAANVDTAFIVCSMNEDFNPSRIERYLALAQAADAEPVVVLTKADLTDEPESWRDNVRRIDKQLPVITVNALENSSMDALSDWLKPGNTVVMLGSSGVGKSTLTKDDEGNIVWIKTAKEKQDPVSGEPPSDSGVAQSKTSSASQNRLDDAFQESVVTNSICSSSSSAG